MMQGVIVRIALGVFGVLTVAMLLLAIFNDKGALQVRAQGQKLDTLESEIKKLENENKQLTDEIQAKTGLPSSAGIATTRSVAKVASGIAKPRGVRLVPAGSELAFLGPLPVRKFPGIGPVAEQKLALLHCCMAVAAVDADVSGPEDATVREIAGELGLSHEEFIAARSEYRYALAVLKPARG